METKSLIPGAFSITILREPLETFESFYSYMNIDRRLDMDINQFVQSLVTRQESKDLLKQFMTFEIFIFSKNFYKKLSIIPCNVEFSIKCDFYVFMIISCNVEFSIKCDFYAFTV